MIVRRRIPVRVRCERPCQPTRFAVSHERSLLRACGLFPALADGLLLRRPSRRQVRQPPRARRAGIAAPASGRDDGRCPVKLTREFLAPAGLPVPGHRRRGRQRPPGPAPRAGRADDRRAGPPGLHRPAQSAHRPVGRPRRAGRLGRRRAPGWPSVPGRLGDRPVPAAPISHSVPSRSSRATANREIKVRPTTRPCLIASFDPSVSTSGAPVSAGPRPKVGERALGRQPGARALLTQQPGGPGQVGRNLPAHDH